MQGETGWKGGGWRELESLPADTIFTALGPNPDRTLRSSFKLSCVHSSPTSLNPVTLRTVPSADRFGGGTQFSPRGVLSATVHYWGDMDTREQEEAPPKWVEPPEEEKPSGRGPGMIHFRPWPSQTFKRPGQDGNT